jgi:hypothetical protein
MFIWSEQQDTNDPDWQNAMREARQVFERLPHGSYQISIGGMQHFNFSDDAVEFQPLLHLLGYLGRIDGEYGLEITRTYVTSFFDQTLLEDTQTVFEKSPFPEVQIETR